MSKRNLGLLLILLGVVLLIQKLPLPIDLRIIQVLLPYLAIVGFGIYLLNGRNYQFAFPLIYIGVAYILSIMGWLHIVNEQYFGPSILIVIGLGFIVQGKSGRR